jgi:RNA polymerase sigma-70 factor (ECF subfamily)
MDESVPDPVVGSAAFAQTLLPHRDAAYNLARWLMRHDHDAEDCVQDAYVRAYQAFGRFRGGDGRPWLLAIVRNVCYSRLRQNRREEPPASFDEIEHSEALAAPTGELPWKHAAARELLPAAMEKLPAELREILVLHELEGCAYKELASILEVPIGTVMSRLARARIRLQYELQQLLRKDLSHGM